MIELNLIPDVKLEYIRAQKLRNRTIGIAMLVGMVAIGITTLLAITLAGVRLAEASNKGAIQRDFAKMVSANTDGGDLLTLQSQLVTIPELSVQNSRMSNALQLVSSVLTSSATDIKVSSIKVDPLLTTITIEGSTPGGFNATDALRKAILAMQLKFKSATDGTVSEAEKLTDNVQSTQTSFGEDASGQKVLQFSLNFVYPKALLTNERGTVTFVTPQGEVDVTDSKLGVPDSIFSEKANTTKDGQ